MIEKTGDVRLAALAEEILRRRAESLAQEASEDEAGDTLSLLLFRLGEEWYAVRVQDVREIYQEHTITPIPCVPVFIKGVLNIRGEIVSVTDIAVLMQVGTESFTQADAPVIVVQNAECTTAIVVDEVGAIADLPADMVEPTLSGVDRMHADHVAGSVYLDGRLVGVVHVDRILQPIDADNR